MRLEWNYATSIPYGPRPSNKLLTYSNTLPQVITIVRVRKKPEVITVSILDPWKVFHYNNPPPPPAPPEDPRKQAMHYFTVFNNVT